MKNWPVFLTQKLIRFYQICFSPWFGGECRFVPTCSHYAGEAVGRFGFFRGWAKAAARILRCHPFSKGGFDPVPE